MIPGMDGDQQNAPLSPSQDGGDDDFFSGYKIDLGLVSADQYAEFDALDKPVQMATYLCDVTEDDNLIVDVVSLLRTLEVHQISIGIFQKVVSRYRDSTPTLEDVAKAREYSGPKLDLTDKLKESLRTRFIVFSKANFFEMVRSLKTELAQIDKSPSNPNVVSIYLKNSPDKIKVNIMNVLDCRSTKTPFENLDFTREFPSAFAPPIAMTLLDSFYESTGLRPVPFKKDGPQESKKPNFIFNGFTENMVIRAGKSLIRHPFYLVATLFTSTVTNKRMTAYFRHRNEDVGFTSSMFLLKCLYRIKNDPRAPVNLNAFVEAYVRAFHHSFASAVKSTTGSSPDLTNGLKEYAKKHSTELELVYDFLKLGDNEIQLKRNLALMLRTPQLGTEIFKLEMIAAGVIENDKFSIKNYFKKNLIFDKEVMGSMIKVTSIAAKFSKLYKNSSIESVPKSILQPEPDVYKAQQAAQIPILAEVNLPHADVVTIIDDSLIPYQTSDVITTGVYPIGKANQLKPNVYNVDDLSILAATIASAHLQGGNLLRINYVPNEVKLTRIRALMTAFSAYAPQVEFCLAVKPFRLGSSREVFLLNPNYDDAFPAISDFKFSLYLDKYPLFKHVPRVPPKTNGNIAEITQRARECNLKAAQNLMYPVMASLDPFYEKLISSVLGEIDQLSYTREEVYAYLANVVSSNAAVDPEETRQNQMLMNVLMSGQIGKDFNAQSPPVNEPQHGVTTTSTSRQIEATQPTPGTPLNQPNSPAYNGPTSPLQNDDRSIEERNRLQRRRSDDNYQKRQRAGGLSGPEAEVFGDASESMSEQEPEHVSGFAYEDLERIGTETPGQPTPGFNTSLGHLVWQDETQAVSQAHSQNLEGNLPSDWQVHNRAGNWPDAQQPPPAAGGPRESGNSQGSTN